MTGMILKLFTAVLLFMIAWTDYKTMEIPDILNGGLGVCALISLFVFPDISFVERGIGVVCVSVPMYLICLAIEGAFGDGDILLLAVMGFYLGWKALLAGAFPGFLLGGAEAVYLLAAGKAKRGEHAHMAFGPALCSGLVIALFYGREISGWYEGLFY